MAKKKKKSVIKRRTRAKAKKPRKYKIKSINPRKPNDVKFIDRPGLSDIQAPDGFRPISMSQAMVEYSQPLLDYVESGKVKDANSVLQISMAIWNFAVSLENKDEKPAITKIAIVNQIRTTLGMSKSEAIDFFDTMLERKNYLLPSDIQPKIPTIMFMRKEAAFLIHEFNYDQLNIAKETIPPNDDDKKMVAAINSIDKKIINGIDYGKWEKDFIKMEEKCQEQFRQWLVQKGLQTFADEFSENIPIFFDFVYRYMHQDLVILSNIKPIYIEEFFSDFLLRKMYVHDPNEYTTYPPALQLLYTFLHEKTYLNNPKPIIKMFDKIESHFIDILRKRYQ